MDGHIEQHQSHICFSIPGTHDSAAVSSLPVVATQTLSITDQLNAGVRYFDLRCGLMYNTLYMFHGQYPINPPWLIKLEDVIDDIGTWLAVQNSEGVIVQIKEDPDSILSSVTFAAAAASSIVNDNPASWNINTELPTLGQIRGKIQLMRRYTVYTASGEQPIGIDLTSWQGNSPQFTILTPDGVHLTVQDEWSWDDFVALLVLNKLGVVSSLMKAASVSSPANQKIWDINFSSATHDVDLGYVSPEEIALGTTISGQFIQGVNNLLRNLLYTLPTYTTYGTIIMDFPEGPTGDLIAGIVSKNF